MRNPYSGQKFQFQVINFIDVLIELSDGCDSTKKLSEKLGMGVPKIESIVQYLKIVDCVNSKEFKVTNFGEAIIKLKNKDLVYPLIYSKLCRGWENGGHFFFSRMANNVLYERALSYDNTITSEEAKEHMIEFEEEVGINRKDYLSLSRQALTALSNTTTGFGKMGMLRDVDKDNFTVSYYDPEELVAAYVIYDRLQGEQTAVPFKDIVEGDYHIGRIFHLMEDDVFDIFERLRDRKLIGLEVTGGLNQISINPSYTKNDILEEMLDE